jgi:hypothetical protein
MDICYLDHDPSEQMVGMAGLVSVWRVSAKQGWARLGWFRQANQ